MKSGIHYQCSFLFLGGDVQPHGSVIPICSTCALPGPHDLSRHLLLKESLENEVLAVRLLIRVSFTSLACSLYASLHPMSIWCTTVGTSYGALVALHYVDSALLRQLHRLPGVIGFCEMRA